MEHSESSIGFFSSPSTARKPHLHSLSSQAVEEQTQGGDTAEPAPPIPSLPGHPTANPTFSKVQPVLSPGPSQPPKAASPPATPILLEKKSPLGQGHPTVVGQPSSRPSAEEYGYIVTDQK